jgi:hypothetical protein
VKGFTISRITLFSFLMALLLGVGIRQWTDAQRDDCARYLAGDLTAPASELVVMGSRTVVVPCNQWLPRQPVKVQMLCLLDFVLAVGFVLNALHDLRGWLQSRRRARGM